jgi:GT2 family glycosyltransferase
MNNERHYPFPSVSLIIVNYNGKSKLGVLLDKCLESILQTDYPNFEVLFVDNNSTDGSAEYVRGKFSNSRLKVISLEKNYGYAMGANIALKVAKGNVIGILNNDMIFPERDWLKKIIDFITSYSKVDVVVSPLLLYDEERVDSAGGATNILMISWDMLSQRRLNRLSLSKPYHVFSPPGAALFFHRRLLNKLGGKIFDEDYFAYYEDVDLGMRVNAMGGEVIILPYVRVIHKRSVSWGWASPQKFYYLRRNSIVTGIKVFPLRALLVLLPTWLMSTFFASFIYYNTVKDPSFFLVPFKVFLYIIKNMKKLMAKRYVPRIPITKMPFSTKMILPSANLSLFMRIGIAFVNIVASLAGLGHLRMTSIEEYPLFNLWKRRCEK